MSTLLDNKEARTIGIPFHNVRSWYFRRTFCGPDHWDVVTESIRKLVNQEFEYFEPADYWFEISNDQVANVISVVRAVPGPKWADEPAFSEVALELSLNRTGDLFCLSLSVIDFYDIHQHDLADEVADLLDPYVREVLEDVYSNPF